MPFTSSTQKGRCGPRGILCALALLAVLGAAACDVGFVDPNPPELVALTRAQTLNLQDEPVVYGVVMDLHLPDAGECARTRDRLITATQQALAPPARPAFALSIQDVSPGCQQTPERRFDVDRFNTELAKAQTRFPGRLLRPILVYFNNVDLPMAGGLATDLRGLRDEAKASGQPELMLWGMGLPVALQSLAFDETFAWTFSSDPSLTDGLTTTAQKQVPLVTHVPLAAELPLLTSTELDSALALKGCLVTERVVGVNVSLSGAAAAVDRSEPPTYRIEGLSSVPLPRSRGRVETITFQIEVCQRNCDRLYALPHGLQVWSQLPFCFVGDHP